MKESLKKLKKELLVVSLMENFDYNDLLEEQKEKFSILLDEYNSDVDYLISDLEGEFIYKPTRDLVKDYINSEIECIDFDEEFNGIEGVEYCGNDDDYIVKIDFSDKYYIKCAVVIEFDGDEIVYDYYDSIYVYNK